MIYTKNRKKISIVHFESSFLLYFSDKDESDFELDDDDIDKILIITPTPPSTRKQHPKHHDRTGEYTPRARMTAEIAKIIDDGLRWYEEELWQDRPAAAATTTLEKTVKLISQEEMESLRKSSSQSQPVRERKHDDDDDDDEYDYENTNPESQFQADKGRTLKICIRFHSFRFFFRKSIDIS